MGNPTIFFKPLWAVVQIPFHWIPSIPNPTSQNQKRQNFEIERLCQTGQILDTGCLMLEKIRIITFKNQYPRPPRLKAKPMAGRQKPASSIFSIRNSS